MYGKNAPPPGADRLPMPFKRFPGWLIPGLLIAGYIGIFAAGGIDGKITASPFGSFSTCIYEIS